MHVALGCHGVLIERDRVIGQFEGHVRGIGAEVARYGTGGTLRPGAPSKGHQCDIALAGGNGFRGMGDVNEIGGTARVGRIHMAHAEVEVIDHCQRPEPRRIAGTGIAVDIAESQPRIRQRAVRDFSMELSNGFIRRFARRMFVDAHDAGFSLETHALIP